ncbi:hypothetical protein FSP39_023156 [Pinctada imbricata]|uniref:non-specific serine/threonine protein kinase n=1 Tax=Pinctada imbricata TaxID=66713 RepID=A0AA89C4C6_PINIB|nr:hypothetical protein FSP39_023156 [Pinctada imbricata]
MNSLELYESIFNEKFEPSDKQKKVGNYRLVEVIGKGAFGTVWKGKHVLTRNEVAIKVVPKKSILQRDRAKRRFLSETQALKRLEHNNIVKLLTWMETDKNFYLVMEFICGESLKRYLRKRGRISEYECKTYIGQITQALKYMHDQDIVHRDIKLDNIVLEKGKDRVKIIDLGLSVNLSKVDNSRLCGSLHYMAPEVLDRQAFSTAVDVWSLGVCLYHLVTGSHPFHHTSIRNMSNMYFHILRGFTLPNSLTEECRDLLHNMLDMNPEDRISTENILIHAWLRS